MLPLVYRAKGYHHLFLDKFTDPLSAGSVNGSPATPGPGTRTVTDTANRISIDGGLLLIAGAIASTSDPRIVSGETITRTAGRLCALQFKVAAGKSLGFVGLITAAGAMHAGVYRANAEGTVTVRYAAVSKAVYFFMFDDFDHDLAILMRADGDVIYVNRGDGLKLLFITPTQTGDPQLGIRPAVAGLELDVTLDNFRIPFCLVQLPVLVSDSFNRTDGALAGSLTDGNGHAEGILGAGVAWSDALGTSEIDTNRAGFSALTGGVGLSIVESGKTDCWLHAKLYRVAGVVGLVVRYVDNDNYVIIYHDGTNVKVDAIAEGNLYNLRTQAIAYADGAALTVHVHDQVMDMTYNGTVVNFVGIQGAYDSLGTKVGFYSTDLGNTIENFYAVDAHLSANLVPPPITKTKVLCLGDSMTSGFSTTEAYLNRLQKNLGNNYVVIDEARAGAKTPTVLLITQNYGPLIKPKYVIVMAGTNDIDDDVAAAVVEANLQAIYTAMHNTGAMVIACYVPPRNNSAGWTAGKQAILDLVNVWIASTAVNVDCVIDSYTLLEDPVTPDQLLAAYDSGDHIHPSAAGYAALADEIYSAVSW